MSIFCGFLDGDVGSWNRCILEEEVVTLEPKFPAYKREEISKRSISSERWVF